MKFLSFQRPGARRRQVPRLPVARRRVSPAGVGARRFDDIPEGLPAAGLAAASADPCASFLSVYFRDMARVAVLRPEQETAVARRIGELEAELWQRALGFTPLSHALLGVVEGALGQGAVEFSALRAAATRALGEGRTGGADVGAAAAQVAERMRRLDADRAGVRAAVAEIKRVAEARQAPPLPVELGGLVAAWDWEGAAWRGYVQGVLRTQRRVQRAKNEFVKANLRLVVSIARRFSPTHMPLADLIQEGNIGLIKAVERFDYRRGYRFSTYASWWIRHAISRGLADKGRAVRLPVHMLDIYHRVARSRRDLCGKLGRPPTTEELGAATGLAIAKIEKVRTGLADQMYSLDREISDVDGRRFIELMQDQSPAAQPTEQLVGAAMATQVRRLLGGLKPIEADILRQRFGLDDDRELTLKEIGAKYNLSRERIRQLQEQALAKMRRAMRRNDMM